MKCFVIKVKLYLIVPVSILKYESVMCQMQAAVCVVWGCFYNVTKHIDSQCRQWWLQLSSTAGLF